MKTVAAVALGCFLASLGAFALGWVGWESGPMVGRVLCLLALFLSFSLAGANYFAKKRGGTLAPVRRTSRPAAIDFPASEFRVENRGRQTAIHGTATAIFLAASAWVSLAGTPRSWDMPDFMAGLLAGVLALVGVIVAWLAFQAWTSYVVLSPDGIELFMPSARARIGWGRVVGFERVQLDDGDGEMRWWFRLVTAERAYLFRDVLGDRGRFIDTVTRATGLELVDVR